MFENVTARRECLTEDRCPVKSSALLLAKYIVVAGFGVAKSALAFSVQFAALLRSFSGYTPSHVCLQSPSQVRF